MHDWSDNELDDLSRDAADKFSPDQESFDWNSLEKRLDEELPIEKGRRKRIVLWFFLSFLAIGAIFLGLQHHNGTGYPATVSPVSIPGNTAPATAVPLNNIAQASTRRITQGQHNPVPVTPVAGSPSAAATATNVNNGNRHSISREATIAANTASRSKIPTKKQVTIPVKQQRRRISKKELANTDNNSVSVTTLPQHQDEQPNTLAASAIAANETVAILPAPEAAKDSINPVLKTGIDSAATSVTNADNPAPANTLKTKKAPPKKAQIGFEFGILGGSDASTVKYMYGVRPGYNAGIAAGYNFSSRWAVTAGFIYTKKNYKVDGPDFKSPGIPSNVKLITVDGNCFMWELPVAARYRFALNRNSSWFGSAGLSSYFMKNEDYTYHATTSGMYTRTQRSYGTNSNYIFSTIALSVGYEKQLGRAISLQVAPYARLPIKEVGWGNISLTSYGVNFMVNFTGLKHSKH